MSPSKNLPRSHEESPSKRIDKKIKESVALASSSAAASPSKRIDKKIKELGDWRGSTLAHVRALIHQADPDVVEEVKWVKPSNPAGVPVWSHDGIICTGETYKDKVKLTFAQGASLKDPFKLFNASLEAGTRRAIDIFDGNVLNDSAFESLIKSAVSFNKSSHRREG